VGVVKLSARRAATGAIASARRETIKRVFRGGLKLNIRPLDAGKYPTDEALRAGAGRTNREVNKAMTRLAAYQTLSKITSRASCK
jgi:hypothetical protein